MGATVRKVEQNDACAVQMDSERFGYEDGIGSIINHSCDPNCGVRAAESGMFDLAARKPIECSEEITVDYAMRNFIIEFFPETCLCGTALCRGLVTGWKDLPQERRHAYRGYVAPFLLDIERELPLVHSAS